MKKLGFYAGMVALAGIVLDLILLRLYGPAVMESWGAIGTVLVSIIAFITSMVCSGKASLEEDRRRVQEQKDQELSMLNSRIQALGLTLRLVHMDPDFYGAQSGWPEDTLKNLLTELEEEYAQLSGMTRESVHQMIALAN